MAPPRFDIYFSGALVAGADPAVVRERLARLFKLGTADVDRLFGGGEVRIKKDADVDTASRLRATFREAGALIDIRVAASPARPPATPAAAGATTVAAAATTPDTGAGWTLSPPRTGSLADYAAQTPPVELPDVSWMSLAPPGSPVADPVEVPAVEIDVTHLSMTAPSTGSLEDCRTDRPARPLPDIGHLKLSDG
jgi:hypothetical protein